MVSDSVLVNRLHELLRSSDLETTTAVSIRRRLEEEFTVDLYGRRAFIREQIDLFLRGGSGQNDGAEQEEEVDENAQNDAVEEEQQQGEIAGDDEISGEEEIPNEQEASDEGRGKKRKKSSKTDTKKKGGGGFSKPSALSPQLQKFCGVPELARTEVVRKIWAYIREHNLQNPKNRKKILCDESLHGIFRVKSIDMFQMNKALSKHIWPLDEAEGSDEPKRKEKPKKGNNASGLTAPHPLSNALVKFFGTGENELSRVDVVKRMWQYIKENELQDPSDKRMVLCDDKLKELFGVDSFHGFTVSKLLTSHFIKTQG
ncbi:upstream activation factor subunit uaf30 [Phtheirospermum japonicum]|uniref:Upstream activation factor subunit uaf30 n=1 Tax=Phtheirospermum japonicum TaxID=374723 RepID=A0A830D913_9LAMI|nr:upstream activation factor subunit uaf30 [Phtheirospermum japonicum]